MCDINEDLRPVQAMAKVREMRGCWLLPQCEEMARGAILDKSAPTPIMGVASQHLETAPSFFSWWRDTSVHRHTMAWVLIPLSR